MAKAPRGSALYGSLKELSGLSAFLLYLAEAGNDRLTINQAAFFMLAAASDIRGVPVTLSEIMERGEGVLNASLRNTYKVLLDPTRDYKGIGLGWLERVPDPDDERRKYLKLTDKGREVIQASLITVGRNTYGDDEYGTA